MSARFTIDGSSSLEQHLAEACTHVRAGVERITRPANSKVSPLMAVMDAAKATCRM
ncbi:MAG: hypothetical protein K9N47_14330 [Prosthecobacter sp.]|uniref:hypothetical protein n=1 Tax=Prosthecobacter sp. TaxID=1965333 RepID=UPI002600B608|nr:hypothetical protein [Prosthecobacter sp.]MCF7787301.1 hypothetical protein [Prosthecobacter sp.]